MVGKQDVECGCSAAQEMNDATELNWRRRIEDDAAWRTNTYFRHWKDNSGNNREEVGVTEGSVNLNIMMTVTVVVVWVGESTCSITV